MVKILMIIGGCLSLGLGILGVFLPVLPTTPLVLLAGFLFARSSPKLHAWLQSTWVYKNYVTAFLRAGGIPFKTKVRALAISYGVMTISAILVRNWIVWIALGCVALFLLWLFMVRIPTVNQKQVQEARSTDLDADLV